MSVGRGEIAVHRATGTVAWLVKCLNRQYSRPADLLSSLPGLLVDLKAENEVHTQRERGSWRGRG